MGIEEKIKREDGSRINLYKQGVFWVAYEESAAMLCREKALKVKVSYCKPLDREIHSVGFPESIRVFFISLFGPFEAENNQTGSFLPRGGELSKQEMMDFREQNKGANAKEALTVQQASVTDTGTTNLLIERIRAYPLSE